ncbi:MAG: hypothetical protein V4484_17895 [Pseudomonadota bacterium]
MKSLVLLASLALWNAPARAGEPPDQVKDGDEKVAEVAVSGTRDPELKPYRVMAAGMDAFDEHHRLAPAATLQFRLSKRGEINRMGGNWDGVSMRLAGNDTSIPVPIAADGTFVLPRNQQAYDDEADLILNQKKSLIRFSPVVRTPGLPANVWRLGDLRLECQVLVGIAKKELNFAQRLAISTIMLGGNWCGKGMGKFGFSLPDRSLSTTLVYGATRRPVPTSAYQIVPPIQDQSVPDDALLEFEFWSGASVERKLQYYAQWPIRLKNSANKWGASALLRPKDSAHYSTEIALDPGTWEFRLESPGAEISLGSVPGDTPVVAGVDHALQWHWNNLALHIEQAGTYQFTLNVQDPDHPLVNVKRVDALTQ